jgi:DNA-binding CsgD family transcriptional regulator
MAHNGEAATSPQSDNCRISMCGQRLGHLPEPVIVKNRRVQLPLSLLLLAIAIGGTIDLVLDQPSDWLSFHTIYEVALVIAAAGTAAWLWNQWRAAEDEGARLRRTVSDHEAERQAWRAREQRALAGFAKAVDDQFTAWRLTPAERDVALQLLKGKSHKEIAAESSRSERTVRQHATAVYGKAGVDGRAELGAFFLEGLTLPPPGGATSQSGPYDSELEERRR